MPIPRPATGAVAVVVFLSALSGCLGDPFDDPIVIQGYHIHVVSRADRQILVETLTSTSPSGGSSGHMELGPATWRESGFLAGCPFTGNVGFLNVALKEPTRNYPDENKELASKRWDGLKCHEKYTVVIDEELGMALYHCDPCKGNEEALPPTA